MSLGARLDRLNRRQRQALAAGILMLLLALVWASVVAPVADWFAEHHDALAQTRAQARTAQKVAAHRPDLSRELEALRANGVLKISLFAQAAEPNPAARLQAEARRLVSASGAQIVNSQILPETSEHGFRRLALRVTLRGRLSKLQKAVYGLESAQAPIFIHGLTMRNPRAAPRPGTAHPAAADLTMMLELHAFMEAGP